MTLYVYNTLTRQREEFRPIHEGRVHMYVCGPTVWNDAHLGHGKTYINFDTIVRYLRYLGYHVLYVQNITDVGHLRDSGEDRILKEAERVQLQPMQLAEGYTRRYFRDMDRLNVTRPDISPRATGHIPEMIELVQKLIAAGVAYEANGSVYFDVTAYPEYGKLSGRRVEDSLSGTRVETHQDKRHPADFALWKRAEQGHIMRWNSPWGEGFPGWHIECSAMSTKYLGQPFDIHGGGVENKFPHHDCEIAQSEAGSKSEFARYWLHNGMLMIKGEEMHKSLGNFITLESACDEWGPMVIRLFVLQGHYRSSLDVTSESMAAAKSGWERLHTTVSATRRQLLQAPAGEVAPEVAQALDETRQRFDESMNQDFGTPGAVAALFDLTRQVNTWLNGAEPASRGSLEAVNALFERLAGDVLGLAFDQDAPETDVGLLPDLVELLVDLRAKLRVQKEWALADEVRDRLETLGVQLKDGADGTTWTIS